MPARRKAGRPRGPAKVAIGIRLPEDLAMDLQRTAWAQRAERGAAYGPSALVEEALREWFARHGAVGKIAIARQAAGLLGKRVRRSQRKGRRP